MDPCKTHSRMCELLFLPRFFFQRCALYFVFNFQKFFFPTNYEGSRQAFEVAFEVWEKHNSRRPTVRQHLQQL